MNIVEVVKNMSEDMYKRLKYCAETGRWPEGQQVSEEQRASALQLSMAYQAQHLDSDQMLTVGADGEIVHKNKRELKEELAQDSNDIARFTDL